MKVLVTGATGFTGSYTVPELIAAGHEVTCFVRPSSDRSRIDQCAVSYVEGSLEDRASLTAALRGKDALVNIASLGFGHAANIVNSALAAGVSRALFISTTAIFTSLNAPSKIVRLAAEKLIMESGLQYTILRPTMIYGSSKDRNMCRLVKYLHRFPLIPMLGSGEYLQQPVYVGDLAKAIVLAIGAANSINKAYNIAGAAPVSYNQVIDIVCAGLRRKVWKLHIPAQLMVNFLATTERMRIRLPIKSEQVQRLNEDKAFDYSDALRDFNYAPLTFAEGIAREIAEMGL